MPFDFTTETTVRADDWDAPFADRVIAALRALLAQGDWSVTYGAGQSRACQYRGDGGRKCIVGMMIPDESYRTDLEGVLAPELLPGSVCRRVPTTCQGALLRNLQAYTHDDLSYREFHASAVIHGAIDACAMSGFHYLAERIRREFPL